MKGKTFFVFFLIVTVCSAQNTKLLKGKVVADVKELRGVNVVNLASREVVATLEDGLFSVYAKPGDTLIFTAVQLNEKRIVIEKEDFYYLPFLVKMNSKVTQIKEVVIERSSITAESLGLISRGIKKYTPAERRYYTATSGPVDAIANALNGKTNQLKKEIVAEKYQTLQYKLELMFVEAYFVDELKIPPAHLNGFYVFAAENEGFANVMQQKNRSLIKFELVKLAFEYIRRMSDEK